MKTNYFICSLIIVLFTFNLLKGQTLPLGIPFSKYYSSQDYEGGIQNWRITQSMDGLLYVANNFGLLEYDGTTWTRYALKKETKLRDVHIGPEGRIYVASQGDFGYLFPNEQNKLEYTSLADSLPANYRDFDEAWRVFEENEHIIFCTFSEIFLFNKAGKLEKIINPEYDPENFYQVNQRVYINQLETGLTALEGNELKPVPNGSTFKQMTITGMIPFSNNRLWIATLNNGIYLSNSGSFSIWSPEHQDLYKHASINEAIRLRNGNIALGTQNEGLIILDSDGKLIMHLNKGSGLNNRTVLSLFEDLQGNLWVGHNNGITMIELSLPFTHINEQAGLPGTGYDAYKINDRIMLGTNNGLYYKKLSEPSKNEYQFVQNTEGQVYNVTQINKHLLLGHHHGAFEIRGDQAESFSSILGAWTFLPLRDHPEYIIEGTYKGLILHKQTDNGLQFVRKIDGLNESSRVMEQDEEGFIWMTHGYKGVFRLKLNNELDSVSVKYYGEKHGLPSNLLINVWKVGNRLLFTTENEIYVYNKSTDSFVREDYLNEFLGDANTIVSLAEDPLGNIYYIDSKEVGVLKKQIGEGYKKETSVFNRLNLLLNDDLQNISVLNANQVLFAAKEGFILYNMNESKVDKQDFQTLIRSVSVTSPNDSIISSGWYLKNDKSTNQQPEERIAEIPFISNSLRIEFSAPFMDSQNRTLYQYKLENAEDSYSEWTSKTDKEYTNLREGTYTFHVRAKNMYDKVSKEATFTFTILPPWYRTNIAYATYIFIIGSILFTVFMLMDVRYRKRAEKLTEKQEKELNRKETALKSSEEEIERLRNEKLEAEINSKNKELATATMHLINKNGFIGSIKSNLTTIMKRSKNGEVKKEITKVIHNIDRNISEDDDWEHFAIHFDQVHGDFSNRLKEDFPDLSPQEMKLSAYLRMNLSTKEIAHLLNISVRGVEIARYRLRKKLNLDRATNLQEFILKY